MALSEATKSVGNAEFDVLIPGHYFCDLVFTGLEELPVKGREIYSGDMQLVPGGGALNTTIALQALRVRAGWIGAIGTDFASRYVDEWLAEHNVDRSLVQRLDTSLRRVTVALSYPEDRAFVSYVDPAPDVLTLLQNTLQRTTCRHIHFPGLIVDDRLPDLLDDWRESGVTVSMDCQTRPHTLDMPSVQNILRKLTIFMPNASEALRLTRTDSLSQAATALRAYAPMVVVKDGANGAHLWCEGESLHSPALRVNPVDTTGAGDVFNAGFLAAYLAGFERAVCLQWGNCCAGLSTLSIGGSIPGLDDVQSTLAAMNG
jgi:sugar/nucleoside kinase (ribokinase family)